MDAIKDTVKDTMFFSIRNLADLEVAPMEKPWNYDASSCPWGATKDAYKAWMRVGSTDHCLYSMVEPQHPSMRTSKNSNEAEYIHGFVADYDGIAPDDPLSLVEKKAETATIPNYVTTTFSDKVRLVWMFERPMRVLGTSHAEAMLKFIGKKLHADKWFAGIDKLTYDPKMFWCIGKKWTPTSKVNNRIKGFTLDLWLQEYFFENEKNLIGKTTSIPYEDIIKEATDRGFQHVPNFVIGKHCRRFWAPESDNDNGCLLTEHGVLVFVPHDKPFMSWRDIFGPAFTSKYENREFQEFFDLHFYDHNKRDFWFNKGDGVFVKRDKSFVVNHLKCLGCSSTVPKGETSSEMDKRLLYLELRRGIDLVREMVYFPSGVMRDHDRKDVLNISRIRTIDPSAPMCDATLPWNSKEVASAFPFIHGLITHLFNVPVPGWKEGQPTQIDYLLWFLARFYRSGYYRSPASGHAIFLGGGVGHGKSLLSMFIIPQLMGGTKCNAESFILGKTHFSSEISGQPVITLNDCASAEVKAPALIRDLLKKVVADGVFDCHTKQGREETISWYGRFFVTFNTDYESTRILPELNGSVRDKFLYLLAIDNNAKVYSQFGTKKQNEDRIIAELPAFARYLLDMPIPEEGSPYYDVRFGFKAWQHPVLCERCAMDESCDCLIEAFDVAWGTLPKLDQKGKRLYWEGSSAALYSCLAEAGGDHGNESFRRTIRNTVALGKYLAKVAEMGYDIHKTSKTRRCLNKWKIYYGVADDEPVSVAQQKKDGGKDEASGSTDNPAGSNVGDNDTQEVS